MAAGGYALLIGGQGEYRLKPVLDEGRDTRRHPHRGRPPLVIAHQIRRGRRRRFGCGAKSHGGPAGRKTDQAVYRQWVAWGIRLRPERRLRVVAWT